ncbi:bacterial regulatory helix-turn-helix, lysR family protein, partial [Vibrio parahaemolyticus V-223/04]
HPSSVYHSEKFIV